MSYIDTTLMSGEKIIYRCKPHWIIFSQAVIWLIASLIILQLGPRYSFLRFELVNEWQLYSIFSLVIFLLAVYSGISAYVTFISSEFGVTDRRVLMKVGLMRRTTTEILLSRIESINASQGIIGRMFGYGSILVSGTGGSKDFFQNLPDPLDFRKKIQEQIEKASFSESR